MCGIFGVAGFEKQGSWQSKRKGNIMRRLQTGALTALAVVFGLGASQANAQALRGVRADLDVGGTQFSAAGDHDSHIGWGGAAGVDFDLGGFVLGAEGTLWWAPAEVHTED